MVAHSIPTTTLKLLKCFATVTGPTHGLLGWLGWAALAGLFGLVNGLNLAAFISGLGLKNYARDRYSNGVWDSRVSSWAELIRPTTVLVRHLGKLAGPAQIYSSTHK